MKNAWKSPMVGAALIILLTVVAYLPVWRAGFIWDDDDYVTHNPALRSLEGVERTWFEPGATVQYYPLAFTSFWVEYHLWGLRPLGYHLVNVLLHSSDAVLLWFVLRRLKVPGSWWAAAIFALHPVCVESVAWVTERKNVLSGLFYFLAVLAWLRFRPLNSPDATRVRDWRYYLLALALFLCALLSKTATCSLPAALLLLTWWKAGRVERREIVPLAPLFVLGAAAGFLTAWVEKHRVGASGVGWDLSFVQRCLVAGRALWFYAGKLFWPRQLTFIYPRWEIDAGAPWPYVCPVAALVVLIALWRLRSRIGRGPLVAVLFFAGTLAPVLGFFNVFFFRYSYIADHFQYLAAVGLISLATGAAAAICERAAQRGRVLGTVAATIVLLMLGVSTWRQARIYQNVETLWRDTLAKNPNACLAQNGLGLVLAQTGQIEEAIARFEQALRISPDFAEAHINLGMALAQQGRLTEAMSHYKQALRIKPGSAMAYYNLGLALAQAGRLTEAMSHYEQALRIKPDDAAAHYNLGKALLRVGRVPEAIEHFEQALRIAPDYAEAHDNLGLALARTGKIKEAIVHLEQVLRLQPGYANVQNNLAWLLATHAPSEGGDPVRAVTLAERACARTGNRAFPYLDTLAAAYAAAGRFQEAVTTGQKAIDLARATGETQSANEIALRLELYRSARAYRESANTPTSSNP